MAKTWAWPRTVASAGVPPGRAFLVAPDAFDPPIGEDPEEWLAARVARIDLVEGPLHTSNPQEGAA